MDFPSLPARMRRVAAHLTQLPPELVEPIISQLPLHDVVEISTASPALKAMVEDSPTWSHVFEGKLADFQRIWAAFNYMSYIWCGQPWKSTPALEEGPWASFPEEFQRGCVPPTIVWSHEVTRPELITPLDAVKDMLGTMFWEFLGNPHKGRRGESLLLWKSYVGLSLTQLRSICLFLPPEIWPCLKDSSPLKDSILGRGDISLDYKFDSKTAPTDSQTQEYARLLKSRSWTGYDASFLLPYLAKAWQLHRKAQSEQLEELAGLYERYPTILKSPCAPQRRLANTQHILEQLQRDSRRALFKTIRRPTSVREPGHYCPAVKAGFPWYRFRYPNAALVPYDDCIQLFCLISDLFPISSKPSMYPGSLLPDLHTAQAGLRHIYSHGTPCAEELLPRLTLDRTSPRVILYDNMEHGSVKPQNEIQWLKSFSTCVAWMQETFGRDSTSVATQLSQAKSVSMWEKVDYQHFIKSGEPTQVAAQLLRDSELCDSLAAGEDTMRPSQLALYLPPYSSQKGHEIAQAISTAAGTINSVTELIYERLVDKVRRRLKQPLVAQTHNSKPLDLHGDESCHNAGTKEGLAHVDSKELAVTAAVLKNLLQTSFKPGASADSVLELIQKSLSLKKVQDKEPRERDDASSWANISQNYRASLPAARLDGPRQKICYICRITIASPHPTFPAMCRPCGEFNIEGSRFSLPHNLRLNGKVGFVTGGRINLGFHTALRLLRCGARVIVSSRYPRDAQARYEKEPDFSLWSDRLRIVGADFRAAVDAFNLAQSVRQIVVEWGGRLDILINNAAQTLTDSIDGEHAAISRELLLQEARQSADESLPPTSYVPRVRGGGVSLIEGLRTEVVDNGVKAENQDLSLQPERTSKGTTWVQSLHDIPYEDVITAHSVNTFVPLILIRELMDLMRNDKASTKTRSYIINVSSREGIFEYSRRSESKSGRHVHNNMSKAGLNMITETEAAAAWRMGIAMNTVDPGYMSASPEIEKLYAERPIGWEDGAGRVLWPVAMGEEAERTGKPNQIWGRFLKHYGAVAVDPGLGR